MRFCGLTYDTPYQNDCFIRSKTERVGRECFVNLCVYYTHISNFTMRVNYDRTMIDHCVNKIKLKIGKKMSLNNQP